MLNVSFMKKNQPSVKFGLSELSNFNNLKTEVKSNFRNGK